MLFGFPWDTDHGEWAFALSILPILLRGLVVTIEASLAGFFVALVLGLIFAVLKGARSPFISFPAIAVAEFCRDTPLLVQLFFLYYVLADYGVILPACGIRPPV